MQNGVRIESMYITVKLLSGNPKPLSYKVPGGWQTPLKGDLVLVPLRAKKVVGVVKQVLIQAPAGAFLIKEALARFPFPQDELYQTFLDRLAVYYQVESSMFIKRLQRFLKTRQEENVSTLFPEMAEKSITLLTDEQQAVIEYLKQPIKEGVFAPVLLQGVTGSGKTEVYKKAIELAYHERKTTFLLLPEVSLAVQFERILKMQLVSIPVYSFHSASSALTKKHLWQALLHKQPCLIIGVHLPVLLPCSNLGLIIIDEEHESGFQEKQHPKINSKEAALLRAQLYTVPILLGSATPAVTSLYNALYKDWKLFVLSKRFAGSFPTIEIALLNDQKQRSSYWITPALEKAIAQRLSKKEQVIIFLNRRGVCFFVQCRGCAFVPHCSSCSVSLTLHADATLRCHYCQHTKAMLEVCPECHQKDFIKKGIGTQTLVSLLQKRFPSARIARADRDTTVNNLLWTKTIQAFENQELDILVGTQTITKGYHFPHVTLVGIIWADSNFNMPFYNAHERTLQQLIQVAGRAGRASHTSTVIVQTVQQYDLLNFLTEKEYGAFCQQELETRQELGYPPFVRFACIEIKHKKEAVVEKESHAIAAALLGAAAIKVLGPTTPPVAQIQKIWSRKIYLKADSFGLLQQAYASLDTKRYKSSLFFIPNPLS